jgi:proteasome alpha subunit
MTEVSGIFFEMKAGAIGEKSREIINFLNKNYKENMSFEDALKLALKALKSGLNGKYNLERIEGAYVDTKTRTFTKIDSKLFKK